ncbi:MAG: DUF454 domain-containing protein [Gammaproteobacteria bacterium HGW-Gammaproteobacteria-8]|nr:MAG: DUF454 domain-containing protein [Gammaproteobacteria bacterium HGW-Gammaproteobacteria-8]
MKSRFGYRVLALFSLSAGTLGLVLPLLPTTPFVLLALWAAARGAPELHGRIRRHPRFAAVLEPWERERAVPTRAKFAACLMMLTSWLLAWWSGAGSWVLGLMLLLFLVVGSFLLSRPSPSRQMEPF